MKVWFGHGSEHSMNLVMVGRFKDVRSAEEARQAIESLVSQVSRESETGLSTGERYSKEMLDLLRMKLRISAIKPEELEQFMYDVGIGVVDETITIKTDEVDVSAFLKVLLQRGARVEVYSAHDYPEQGS